MNRFDDMSKQEKLLLTAALMRHLGTHGIPKDRMGEYQEEGIAISEFFTSQVLEMEKNKEEMDRVGLTFKLVRELAESAGFKK